jgi:HD-GYP domain-containing protein (c-di-GMP phosphodiesterase class II)
MIVFAVPRVREGLYSKAVFRRKRDDSAEPIDPLRAAQDLVAARSPKALLEAAITHALTLSPAATKAWAVLRERGTDRIAAVQGYGRELVGLELVGPWVDGAPRVSTNVTGDLFQPNLPEVRARLAASGLREVRSAIVVPLKDRGEVRGAIVLDAYGSDAFTPGALEAAARWGQVVTPSLELVQDLGHYRTLAWGLTLAFVEAIEARDFALLGHAQRVTSYAMAMARELNLTVTERVDLWFASMLHDLGKLMQDDLSEGEHARLGFNLLSTVPELESARLAILHHHEHFDGSGAPEGLSGRSIPMLSRLIAVANTYDHLTSERGELLNRTEALARARSMAGTTLDPNLMPVLEAVLNQNKATGELRPEGLFPT